jgi:hypothetical protein
MLFEGSLEAGQAQLQQQRSCSHGLDAMICDVAARLIQMRWRAHVARKHAGHLVPLESHDRQRTPRMQHQLPWTPGANDIRAEAETLKLMRGDHASRNHGAASGAAPTQAGPRGPSLPQPVSTPGRGGRSLASSGRPSPAAAKGLPLSPGGQQRGSGSGETRPLPYTQPQRAVAAGIVAHKPVLRQPPGLGGGRSQASHVVYSVSPLRTRGVSGAVVAANRMRPVGRPPEEARRIEGANECSGVLAVDVRQAGSGLPHASEAGSTQHAAAAQKEERLSSRDPVEQQASGGIALASPAGYSLAFGADGEQYVMPRAYQQARDAFGPQAAPQALDLSGVSSVEGVAVVDTAAWHCTDEQEAPARPRHSESGVADKHAREPTGAPASETVPAPSAQPPPVAGKGDEFAGTPSAERLACPTPPFESTTAIMGPMPCGSPVMPSGDEGSGAWATRAKTVSRRSGRRAAHLSQVEGQGAAAALQQDSRQCHGPLMQPHYPAVEATCQAPGNAVQADTTACPDAKEHLEERAQNSCHQAQADAGRDGEAMPQGTARGLAADNLAASAPGAASAAELRLERLRALRRSLGGDSGKAGGSNGSDPNQELHKAVCHTQRRPAVLPATLPAVAKDEGGSPPLPHALPSHHSEGGRRTVRVPTAWSEQPCVGYIRGGTCAQGAADAVAGQGQQGTPCAQAARWAAATGLTPPSAAIVASGRRSVVSPPVKTSAIGGYDAASDANTSPCKVAGSAHAEAGPSREVLHYNWVSPLSTQGSEGITAEAVRQGSPASSRPQLQGDVAGGPAAPPASHPTGISSCDSSSQDADPAAKLAGILSFLDEVEHACRAAPKHLVESAVDLQMWQHRSAALTNLGPPLPSTTLHIIDGRCRPSPEDTYSCPGTRDLLQPASHPHVPDSHEARTTDTGQVADVEAGEELGGMTAAAAVGMGAATVHTSQRAQPELEVGGLQLAETVVGGVRARLRRMAGELSQRDATIEHLRQVG